MNQANNATKGIVLSTNPELGHQGRPRAARDPLRVLGPGQRAGALAGRADPGRGRQRPRPGRPQRREHHPVLVEPVPAGRRRDPVRTRRPGTSVTPGSSVDIVVSSGPPPTTTTSTTTTTTTSTTTTVDQPHGQPTTAVAAPPRRGRRPGRAVRRAAGRRPGSSTAGSAPPG